jgi:CMP-N-acetylneuraminic acid synthetase
MTKKIVALLPMKANSERVKGKNFRDLAGKPYSNGYLIRY